MRIGFAIVATMSLAFVAACSRERVEHGPGGIQVDVAFAAANKCKGSSPEIRMHGVPPGTVSYDVKLTDLDVPSFHHWEQSLTAADSVIPAGAGSGYFGPCPPSGAHRYRLTVTARGTHDAEFGHGETTVTVGR